MTQRDLRFSSACDPAPWRHLGRLPLPDSGFLSVQQASASSEFSEAFRSLTLRPFPSPPFPSPPSASTTSTSLAWRSLAPCSKGLPRKGSEGVQKAPAFSSKFS